VRKVYILQYVRNSRDLGIRVPFLVFFYFVADSGHGYLFEDNYICIIRTGSPVPVSRKLFMEIFS